MYKIIRTASIYLLGIILSLNTFAIYSVAQNSDVNEDIKSGIYQYRQENFDEALAIFKAARKTYPDNSLAAYYLGLTYKRMENYAEARKELEASLNLSPKIKGALIELIDVLYRLNDLEEAKKWIRVAEEEGIRPAQAAFLKGLTLLRSNEYDAAIAAFENAKSLDPVLTHPSDYHIGIAYMRQKKLPEAKNMFSRLMTTDVDTDMAAYADRYLYEISKRLERDRPYHATLGFAFEYDSNVTLNPDVSDSVTTSADKGDTREVWDAKGDYTFRNQDRTLSLKAGYGLRFSKQNDLGDYDYLTNTFSLQPAYVYKKVLITTPTYYSHSIVDSKNYVQSVTTGNLNNILVSDNNMAQVGALYTYNDYMRPPYGAESRSGNDLLGTCGWFWFFKDHAGSVNLKYSVNKDWAHGNNWEYFGNRIDLGVFIPLWKKISLGLNGQLFFKNYTNTHTFFDKKRKDQIYAITPMLSYEVFKNTYLQLQYAFIHNDSNLRLYEYSRNVVSGGVQYRF